MIKRHWQPLLMWTALCALFFGPVLLGQARLPNSDLSGQFHAFGLFQAQELAQGRLPLWSPGSYGGVPFVADTQTAVFYPLRWLTIFLSLPWQFPFYAMQLEGILHIWLAGLFTYALAYVQTRQKVAALLAAVAFGLGGYLTSYPLLQLAVLETITWLPLVLVLLRLAVTRERPLAYLLAAGVALGVSALAGHPQTFLHVSYLAAAYFFFLVWQRQWSWRWLLGGGAAVGLTALGIAMAAWLPAIRYLAFTTRSDVSYGFVSSGMPLLNYTQFLVPRMFSFWVPEYVGVATLVLALLAWLGRKRLNANITHPIWADAEITFWVAVALLAAWVALGDKGIVFELVYRVVPGFSLFRQQERLMSLVSLSVALLGGHGLALWLLLEGEVKRHWLRRITAVLVSGSLLIGLALAVIKESAWLVDWGRQWVMLAGVLVLLWGQSYRWQRGWLLVGLLALDLNLAIGGALNLQPEAPTVFWPQPAWMAQLQADDPGRIDSRNLFYANIGEAYGLEDIRGLSPLKPEFMARFEQLPRPRRWQLLNVTHVLSQRPVEAGMRELAPIERSLLPGEARVATLYRLEAAQPRAWLSYDVQVASDAEAAFATLADPTFDPQRQVVLHGSEIDISDVSQPATPPQVTIVAQEAGRLMVDVTTATTGVLVLSEWAYPGWQATVNGEPTALLTADYALQGVLLPAGSHTVALRFAPLDVTVGLVVTGLTLFLALLLAWRWRPQLTYRLAVGRRSMPPIWAKRPLPLPSLAAPPLWLLITLLLVAFGLRLYTAEVQELRADEAFSTLFASRETADIIPGLIRTGETLSPFHYLLLNLWSLIVGQGELALRYMSVCLGMLLLPLMYQLGRQLKDKQFGLLVMLFVMLSQLMIWASQDVRNAYAWTPVLEAIATLMFLRVTEERVGRAWLWWSGYAVVAALTVYSHYYGVFALIGHGFFVLFDAKRRRAWLPWSVSGLVAFLLFVPWPLVQWRKWVYGGYLTSSDVPDFAVHLVRLWEALTVGEAYDQDSGRWLVLGVVAIAVFGFYALRQQKVGWAAFLSGWLGSGFFLMYLFRFQRDTFNDFYISVAAPAWWLLVAAGIVALWQRRQQWRWGVITAVLPLIVIAANLISLSHYYFDPNYNRTIGYRPIAEQIKATAGENDLFLANAPDPSLTYYLRRVDLPQQMLPSQWGESDEAIAATLSELAETYERIWFVPDSGELWDKAAVVRRWLDYHQLQEYTLTFDKLTLHGYRPLHMLPEVMTPLNQPLNGNKIVLDAAFVSVDGVPVALDEVIVGGAEETAVDVTLLWHANEPIDEDYTVFVHLLDENGQLIAQHDGVPVVGTRHTSTWLPDEPLLDLHEMIVPADVTVRKGRLWVGMYHTETVTRLGFEGGGDAWPIGEVLFEQ